jgi:hypothetical protein
MHTITIHIHAYCTYKVSTVGGAYQTIFGDLIFVQKPNKPNGKVVIFHIEDYSTGSVIFTCRKLFFRLCT